MKQYIPKLVIADDRQATFEGQSSQPENSGDTLSQIHVEYSALIAHLGDRCAADGNMNFLSATLKYLTNTYKASTLKHILHS